MARRFTTTDRITCAVGGNAAVGSGAYTTVWLYKVTLFAGVAGLGALRYDNGGTPAYARETLITGNRAFGLNEFTGNGFPSPPDPAMNEDVWIWLAQRKAAGNAHYEYAFGYYPIADPDTDIVFGEDSGAANHNDPGAGDEVWIGAVEVSGDRAIALQAFFTSRLSDAVIKSIFSDNLASLMAAGPSGCWPLNQAVNTDPVSDVTGNGADSTAVTGTTIIADPPGYDFDLAGETVELAGSIPVQTLAAQVAGFCEVDFAGSIPLQSLAVNLDLINEVELAGSIPLQQVSVSISPPVDTVPMSWIIEQGLPVWRISQA